MNNDIYVLTHWDPDGPGPAEPLLIAAGVFTTAGGVTVNRIAAWDGESWRSLNGGMNDTVRALAVFPGTNELIAAGDFTMAGGVPAVGIARWNGVTWAPLGTGTNNIVTGAAILPSGDLFITGSFTAAGGVPSVRAARWDGTAWHNVANGAAAESIAVTPEGVVYAGGNFNGGASPNILSWQGPDAGMWTGVGGGLGGCYGGERVAEVRRLSNGDILVGGSFATTRPGCTAMRLVARWDGNAWNEMYTTTLASAVSAMYVTPDDDIFVGTNWTNIWPGAGCAAFHWNGADWDNIGYFDGGGGPFVTALEPAPGGGFYAAGRFQYYYLEGNWIPANYIAIYTPPVPLITAQPRSITICPAGPATFSITALGQEPITYAWQHNGAPLQDEDGHVSGADAPTLTLAGLTAGDQGDYFCIVTNDCGNARTAHATLTLCLADFNCDGLLNSGDFFDFLNAFFNGAVQADFNHDDSINSQDFFDFLAAFFAGC
jgi:hypothetical protein